VNPNDAKNLEFLLTVSPATLTDWFEQADSIDIAYAMELLAHARTEVDMQSLAITDDAAEEDLSLAANYLSKFRL
jgi:hypothetical protein